MLLKFCFSYAEVLSTENMKEVLDLTWDYRSKWMFIGIALGIDMGTLKAIEKDKKDTEDCLVELLNKWLCCPKATRSALTTALQSRQLIVEAASTQGIIYS